MINNTNSRIIKNTGQDVKQTNITDNAPLVLTTGEPAGIGMDIVLQLASDKQFAKLKRPVLVLADEEVLIQRAELLQKNEALKTMPKWKTITTWQENNEAEQAQLAEACLGDTSIENTALALENFLNNLLNKKDVSSNITDADFLLIDIPCKAPVEVGVLNSNNALMVINQLRLAHHLAYEGRAVAIVTAPLQKSILIDADICLKDGTMFTGHTEFFMQQSGRDKVVMMLANTAMRVALVTIHLPLREVADAITKQNVRQTVQIVLDDLVTKFAITNPRILVCGLNPHAGEGGHLGMEEMTIINPVLQEFQQQGVDISDAMPADTLFTPRHLKNCDAVIAMFHDQGLPVLKSHGFGDTVNLTLGLPYIRTSVDHGTALDLAGTGQANNSSLWQALTMADDMAGEISNKNRI